MDELKWMKIWWLKERRVQAGGGAEGGEAAGAKKYGTMGECDAGGAMASLQNEPMPAIQADPNGYTDPEGIYPDPDPSNQVHSLLTIYIWSI